ncbi:MAG: type II secretion system F family protein [Lachnospiraceae bacterium]
MPEYKYKAKDMTTGKMVSGIIQAGDEAAFYREMERKKLACVSLKEKGNVDSVELPYRFKLKELSVFCREFSIMLSAGIPLVDVLNKLNLRTTKKEKKRVYLYLIEAVEKGNSLAVSMEKLGKVFPSMLVEMVRVGEQSGTLEIVVDKMAVYYEKEYKTKSKVTTVMIYPVILLVVTFAIMILLFTFVMPKFFTIFSNMELPAITRFFMAISNFLINDWLYLILGILAVFVAVSVINSTKKGRFWFDRLKANIPGFSALWMKGMIERFANTMYILTSSGIVIMNALEICGATFGNTFLRSKLDNAREEVQKGVAFSRALEKENLFEDLVWSMIATGEETGNADEMYLKLSKYYEQESEDATSKMLAVMEPCILLVIGGIIALVVVSILIPIYSMYRQ